MLWCSQVNIALAMSRVEFGKGAESAVARCLREGTEVRERWGAAARVSARVKSLQRRQIGSSWEGESGGVGREVGRLEGCGGREWDGSGGGFGREVSGIGGGDGGREKFGLFSRSEGSGGGGGSVVLGGGGSLRRGVTVSAGCGRGGVGGGVSSSSPTRTML